MKELLQILERLEALQPGETNVLATVVDVQGSGYRLPGARMLIDEFGNSIGSVSGGCLEADLLERAKLVRQDGKPTVIVYDLAKDKDSVFGLQMGCNGIVRVLLELAKNDRSLDFIRSCMAERKHGAIATLVSKTNGYPLPIGSRFFWRDGCNFDEGHVGEELLPTIAKDIESAISRNRSTLHVYETPAGDLEFFIDVVTPPTSILIFGAGHDAIPLSSLSAQLGWKVTVIDRRPAYATSERFPNADKVFVAQAEDVDGGVFADRGSAAVVMSHNFESDREILRRLLTSQCAYIGLLGPKQRTANILDELANDGVVIEREMLERIHAPIGLDIGATTPEAIALSIIAEIQAVLAGRDGGFLRDRKKPIYDR
jgi:xanthine/CO dehydrogenase XdhC/CoxF family maturation factor